MDFADLIFFIGILLLIVNHKNENYDYLSFENTTSMKGLLALFVVFHHLSQRTSVGYFFQYFTRVGYLTVATFFFISGYGLITQLRKKQIII